jgi:hypothetical protein
MALEVAMSELLRSLAGRVAVAVLVALLAGLVSPVAAEDKDKKKDKKEKLPQKVMDALKAKFPKAVIKKWDKEKEGDDVVYDVEFEVGGVKYEADIKEDGTILEYEKEIAIKDLPKAVTEAIEKKYPKSKLEEAMEITKIKDKKESPGGYEVTLETKDKKKVEVTVSAEGKILEDSSEKKEEKKDK